MSLITQHRMTTPVPTLHLRSVSTFDHHGRDLIFPGWIRQHTYIRLHSGSPAGDVASKQSGREGGRRARSTLDLDVSFSSSPTILRRNSSQAFSGAPPTLPRPFECTGTVFSTEYIHTKKSRTVVFSKGYCEIREVD